MPQQTAVSLFFSGETPATKDEEPGQHVGQHRERPRDERARSQNDVIMALASVAITAPALEVCVTHALTTENEEIMGLLLGDVVDVGRGQWPERLKVRIWSVSLHRREQAVRSDDRVEIRSGRLACLLLCPRLS